MLEARNLLRIALLLTVALVPGCISTSATNQSTSQSTSRSTSGISISVQQEFYDDFVSALESRDSAKAYRLVQENPKKASAVQRRLESLAAQGGNQSKGAHSIAGLLKDVLNEVKRQQNLKKQAALKAQENDRRFKDQAAQLLRKRAVKLPENRQEGDSESVLGKTELGTKIQPSSGRRTSKLGARTKLRKAAVNEQMEWIQVMNNECPRSGTGLRRGGLVHDPRKILDHTIDGLRDQLAVRAINKKCSILTQVQTTSLNGLICRTRLIGVSSIQLMTALLTERSVGELRKKEEQIKENIATTINARSCKEWRESKLFKNVRGMMKIER